MEHCGSLLLDVEGLFWFEVVVFFLFQRIMCFIWTTRLNLIYCNLFLFPAENMLKRGKYWNIYRTSARNTSVLDKKGLHVEKKKSNPLKWHWISHNSWIQFSNTVADQSTINGTIFSAASKQLRKRLSNNTEPALLKWPPDSNQTAYSQLAEQVSTNQRVVRSTSSLSMKSPSARLSTISHCSLVWVSIWYRKSTIHTE